MFDAGENLLAPVSSYLLSLKILHPIIAEFKCCSSSDERETITGQRLEKTLWT